MDLSTLPLNFVQILDDYLLAQWEDRPHRVGLYYPSELPFPCLRNLYLHYVYPVETKIEALRRYQLGIMWHEVLAKIFDKSKHTVLLGTELSVRKKRGRIRIHGSLDAKIMDIRTGKVFVVEIKSIRSFYYFNVKERRYLPKELPRPNHIPQLNFYLEKKKPNCDGCMLYVTKARSFERDPLRWSFMKFNPEIYDQTWDRARLLDSHLRKKKPPPREPHHWNRRICQYCAYGPFPRNNLCLELEKRAK